MYVCVWDGQSPGMCHCAIAKGPSSAREGSACCSSKIGVYSMQAELPLSRISEVRYSQISNNRHVGTGGTLATWWDWLKWGGGRSRQSLHKPYPITSCGEWAERNLLFLTNVIAVAHKCPSDRITIALNCQVKWQMSFNVWCHVETRDLMFAACPQACTRVLLSYAYVTPLVTLHPGHCR